MKDLRHSLQLYAVTDRAWVGERTLLQQVEEALEGGVTCVQLREKQLEDVAFLAEALELKELCRRYGVPLIINDRADLALKVGADGVHVGQEDTDVASVRAMLGPDKIIGASAHSVAEARAAQAAGADYLGVGAVFGTATKSNVCAMPLSLLGEICASVTIPVVAIGGVKADNLARLAGTGVAGAAIVSGIFAAEDIRAECRQLLALSRSVTGQN